MLVGAVGWDLQVRAGGTSTGGSRGEHTLHVWGRVKREGEGDTQQVVWTGIVLQGRELDMCVCDRGDTNDDFFVR